MIGSSRIRSRSKRSFFLPGITSLVSYASNQRANLKAARITSQIVEGEGYEIRSNVKAHSIVPTVVVAIADSCVN